MKNYINITFSIYNYIVFQNNNRRNAWFLHAHNSDVRAYFHMSIIAKMRRNVNEKQEKVREN